MTDTQQTAGPAVDLIEHAAAIIVAKQKEEHTGPYHWAGALWEAGMLQPPGHAQAADPDVYADNQRLHAERDNATHQRQALQNQVDALVREVRRLQHADRRAVRYALEKDREVAEVDAKLAARDAEIARLNAREAARQVQLHDANGDAEDLRTRLKATSDACNDAENRLHTMTEVARGNKQHVAVLTELLERVEKYADRLADYCSPHGVAARYSAELRAVMSRPTEVERAGATRPTTTTA